jgi:hypothetical protein
MNFRFTESEWKKLETYWHFMFNFTVLKNLILRLSLQQFVLFYLFSSLQAQKNLTESHESSTRKLPPVQSYETIRVTKNLNLSTWLHFWHQTFFRNLRNQANFSFHKHPFINRSTWNVWCLIIVSQFNTSFFSMVLGRRVASRFYSFNISQSSISNKRKTEKLKSKKN